ncbi:MAG TPA: MFS transporter [Ktedonosporobacter sp.]|nr:MFS transporter [Ktedonosporobacter sp.]
MQETTQSVPQAAQNPRFGAFLTIWFGQLVSLIGSGLTSFALGVWVYQNTGSVFYFSIVILSATLPGLIISPLAGVLVDRYQRRLLLILCDLGGALANFLLVILLLFNQLSLWEIGLISGLNSLFMAFRMPAYTASITLLVPKEHLGRASGMVQMAEAVGQILGPLLAGFLLASVGLRPILLVDLATFLFAVVTLFVVAIPQPKRTSKEEEGERFMQAVTYGWRYIASYPGLLGLLLFFAILNFFFGIGQVLLPPLILRLSNPGILGSILAIGSAGVLVGSIVMSIWGGPKRHIYGVLGFGFFFGITLILVGIQPLLWLIGVAVFCMMFCLPVVNGCSQAIWQAKVDSAVQGRVFAIRSMIAWSSTPVAYLLAGFLADQVFDPLLIRHGALAGSLGQVIGTGPGRGIGFLFILLGVLSVIAALAWLISPTMRHLERELPDAIKKSA